MVGFAKTFGHYHHKFNFGYFFRSSVNLLKNLNVKFRPKLDLGLTNHGYSHCAILKALYSFKA